MEFYQEPEESRIQIIVNWIVDVIVVIAFACYLVYAFGSRAEVSGSSMSPVLNSGDVVLMNRLAYDLGSPERFDIAVFSKEDASYNMKRIIGLPGETVYIDENGYVYIDGKVLKEDYIKELANDAGIASVPVVLGEDEYFVMGDNRNNSTDSRSQDVGVVHRDEFIGRAFMRIWPITDMEILKHE